MYIRLAIALIVAAILAATHWKAYTSGKAQVQKDVVAAQQKAEKEQVQQQQQLLAEKHTLEKQYVKNKTKQDVVVRATRTELDRLRDKLRSYSPVEVTATCPRIDADPRDTIIRECSEAAQSLARVADENGLKLMALQSYVTQVCLK
jgi:Tfp pilus assembly protein PilE